MTTYKDLLTADTFGAAQLFQMKIWSPLTDLLSRRSHGRAVREIGHEHLGLTTKVREEAQRDVLAAAIGCFRMALELGDRLGASREVMREIFEHVAKIHYAPGRQPPANDDMVEDPSRPLGMAKNDAGVP